MHTWRTLIDYRIAPPTDLADGGVIAKPCSDHIFAIGNPDRFGKQVSPCWGGRAAGPVVQAAFTPFIWAQMNHTWQTGRGPY